MSPCIYRLPGLVLYSEEVSEDGENLVFNMTRTAIVALVMGQGGSLGIQAVKGSESPHALYAETMTVRKDSVWGIQDTVNEDLVMACKQAISGLILAKGIRR